MKKIYRRVLSVVVLGIAFLYWQNNDIVVTKINVVNNKIPKGFEGYKILHISDLQNKTFGKGQKRLLRLAKKAKADAIFITGDLIDRNRTDLDAAMELIHGIVGLAPIYYVSGNHEYSSGVYDDLILLLEAEGVHILENDQTFLERKGDKIDLMGLIDIRANRNYGFVLNKLLKNCKTEFQMLLSHRPEIFDLYVEKSIDVAFTGHAHGGQIRLPFVGGLFSPNQGFFPKYTSGVYEKDGSSMIVSRGLGNSKFPFRIFNRPELIEVTLFKGE